MKLNSILKSKPLYVFLIIAAIYVITFFIMPAKGFWICDNGCKFIQMKSLIVSDFKNLAIKIPSEEVISSLKYAPTVSPFFSQIGDKVYGVFSNLFIALSSIFFLLFGFRGLYIIPLLSAFLMLPAIWRIAGLIHSAKEVRILSVFCISLCTPLWFYSLTFWEHVPSACLAIWSVYFFLKFIIEKTQINILLCAIFCGLSVYFRDDLVILPVVFTIVLLIASPKLWRQIICLNIAVGIVLSPLWIFQWIVFGNPMGCHVTSVSIFSSSISGYAMEKLEVFRHLLLKSNKNLILSIIGNLPFAILFFIYPRISQKRLASFFVMTGIFALINGFILISGYFIADAKFMLVGFTNGLFGAAPFVIFSLFRIKKETVENPEDKISRIIWLLMIIYAVLYIIFSPLTHSKGLNWGCRFLLILYPLMGILAVSNLFVWFKSNNLKKWMIPIPCCVIVMSFLLQIYSCFLLYEKKSIISKLIFEIAARPENVIVSNVFFTALDLAPIFYDKKIFLCKSDDLNNLYGVLRNHTIKRILLVANPDRKFYYDGDYSIFDGKYIGLDIMVKQIRL